MRSTILLVSLNYYYYCFLGQPVHLLVQLSQNINYLLISIMIVFLVSLALVSLNCVIRYVIIDRQMQILHHCLFLHQHLDLKISIQYIDL